MNISPLASKSVKQKMLVNIPRLDTASYTEKPNAGVRGKRAYFVHPGIGVLH